MAQDNRSATGQGASYPGSIFAGNGAAPAGLNDVVGRGITPDTFQETGLPVGPGPLIETPSAPNQPQPGTGTGPTGNPTLDALLFQLSQPVILGIPLWVILALAAGGVVVYATWPSGKKR